LLKRIFSLILVIATLFTLVSCTPDVSGEPTPTPAVTDTPTPLPTATTTPVPDTTGMTQQEIDIGLKKYVPSKSFKTRPGLYVENGVIMHEGEPFYNIGINFFSEFSELFSNPVTGMDECDRIFKLMNEHGMKYCRVNFGMFWPVNYESKENNLKDYYTFMDIAVKKAEEYDIGLICSMFWNMSGLSDYLDEPTGQWGNPDSKTRQYMRDYTTLVVNRYKDSPAIWGWEFSNELSLHVDLPNRREFHGETTTQQMGSRPYRDENDDMFTDPMMEAMVEWANIVKENDPHGRMITTGNSEPRPSQWNQYHHNSWTKDTEEQMGEIMAIHTPDPVNVASIHTYGLLERFPGSETYPGVIGAFKKAADNMSKPLFIGEFSGLDMANSKAIIDAIVEHKVQLSACWAIGHVEHSLDNDPAVREEIFDYIKAANEALAK